MSFLSFVRRREHRIDVVGLGSEREEEGFEEGFEFEEEEEEEEEEERAFCGGYEPLIIGGSWRGSPATIKLKSFGVRREIARAECARGI